MHKIALSETFKEPLLPLTEADNAHFMALANELLVSSIAQVPPAVIYIIRVDHWFDAKWLNFSGKTLGASWRMG